uniref:DUF4757 domain-containing protein n=1 Tax=Mesocestoides corti TaxID=53468 RepID=A0A5K3G2H2_MESCO
MDDESWQLNLESWRERRRAATRALSQELAFYGSPTQHEYEPKTTTKVPEGAIQQQLRNLKTPERCDLNPDSILSASAAECGLPASKISPKQSPTDVGSLNKLFRFV